eukprot:CAMPEP_0194150146 /NCGR_PEP_ID=MMETSP0152-20130528/41732_1 /TAXON_ID=1049557 /ORGANISM="Thalassiothrix antarctica, Strain L6-D1" /LENGTH=274 /DNA_ID=CAMNT_0038852849 /DNA_START=155 /DNA_END=979 /DNA_ORIENTATION=+
MSLDQTQGLSMEARRMANLRVLQRSDTFIESIIESATHVGLYEFLQDDQRWEKKPIEGSLFLVTRSCDYLSCHQLVVLNRSSAKNWTIDVNCRMQLQNTDPYLIIRQNDDEESTILGIWFHNGEERDKIATLLSKAVKCLELIPTKPKSAIDPSMAASALLANFNIGEGITPVFKTPNPQSSPGPNQKLIDSANKQQYNENQQILEGGQQTSLKPQSRDDYPNQQHLVLDKKSLQLSLLSLIQDERFLDLIHAQYLKVAHARANRKPGNRDSTE